MTWGEWVMSAYNTGPYFIDNTKVMVGAGSPLYHGGDYVYHHAEIQADTAYSSMQTNTPTMIEFYVNNIKQQAEIGMTFGEWMYTDYNDVGCEVEGTTVVLGENTPLMLDGKDVETSHQIKDGAYYETQTSTPD